MTGHNAATRQAAASHLPRRESSRTLAIERRNFRKLLTNNSPVCNEVRTTSGFIS